MKRRIQVHKLSLDDLAQCRVWEFALDEEGRPGQDEETLRPRPDLEPVDPGEGTFIVACEFTASDGTRFGGFCTVSGLPWPLEDVFPELPGDGQSDLDELQPVIITEAGHVPFWLGAFAPERGELDRLYEIAGKTAGELFPVSFRGLVEVTGVMLEGEIPAFLHQGIIEVT